MVNTIITIKIVSIKSIGKVRRIIVVLLLFLLTPTTLHGAYDAEVRKISLPAATVLYEPMLKFLNDVIVPLAKRIPEYPEVDVTLSFQKSKGEDKHIAYILANSCRYGPIEFAFEYLNSPVKSDKDIYVMQIDGINIVIKSDIPDIIKPIQGKEHTIKALYNSLMIDDRSAIWTFVLKDGQMEPVCFEDWGLSWLEGVPREFYDPGYRPVLKLDPNIPRSVCPCPKDEAPGTFLPINVNANNF